MTGRTHDLAAFTALNLTLISGPIPQMSLATAVVAFGANMIGGLAPDIDQPTGDLWRRLPAGTILGKILAPFLGGHRFISHSILGVFLFGIGLRFILDGISSVLLVNMGIVWWSFMIGFVSHLIMDTFTKEGVPWLFPIAWRIGIPPLKFFRIKTGGVFEKSVVFPGLLIFCAYIIYTNYTQYLDFVHKLFK